LKSRQDRLKVLIDTSFILPTLGIDVGEEVLRGLRQLADSKCEIWYSQFSILESLWTAARLLGPKFKEERFATGIRSIIEGGAYRKVQEDSRVCIEALRIYAMGHRDMVDNILYADSVFLNLKLLSTDNELKDLVTRKGLTNTIITPKELQVSE